MELGVKMGYVIKATYITGDSFHTEETSSELDPVWHDGERFEIEQF